MLRLCVLEDRFDGGAAPGAGPRAVVGTVRGFDGAGRPVVDFVGNPGHPRLARVIGSRARLQLPRVCAQGRGVLLGFEEDDPGRPVILGVAPGGRTGS